jgi:hypothetical protein
LKQKNTLRIAGAVTALAAAGVVATSGGAAIASGPAKVVPVVIEIKGNNHPRFEAPETAFVNGAIQVVNKTDPSKIGPHTFSLIEKSARPRTVQEMKDCAHFKLVCKDIFKAHQVGPPPDFEIGRPDVEKGADGWDATFDGDTARGDSYLFQNEDESETRTVTAEPGNLWFMCAVHPEMQGKIKIVP